MESGDLEWLVETVESLEGDGTYDGDGLDDEDDA
jgi:hypothetical protein